MSDPFDTWLDRQRIEPLAPPPGAFEGAAQSAARRRRRRAVMAAGVGLLVVTVVAMGSVSWGREAAPPIGPVPTDTGTGTTTASGPAPSSSTPSAAGSRPTPSGSGTGLADVARCTVADLRVTVEVDPRPYTRAWRSRRDRTAQRSARTSRRRRARGSWNCGWPRARLARCRCGWPGPAPTTPPCAGQPRWPVSGCTRRSNPSRCSCHIRPRRALSRTSTRRQSCR